MVTKTLQRHGNTHALVIDKGLMEMMGIQPDTPLHLVVSGNTLLVTPANVGFGEEKMKEVLERLWPKYGQMFRSLAK